MPIGRIIQEQPSVNLGPEPWFVTKISNSTEFADFCGTSGASPANRKRQSLQQKTETLNKDPTPR